MMKERTIRTKFVLFAIVIGVIAAASIAYAGTLLQNNGFNGGYHQQNGIRGTVPDNWTAINLNGNPLWIDSVTFCNHCDFPEKVEGSNALVLQSEHSEDCCNPLVDGWPFDAVLSQQIHGVVSGTAYSLATVLLSFCGGTEDGPGCSARGYAISKLVGIDPTGGTDPNAPSVIWSPPNDDDHHWRDMTVAARARSTTVTVFARMTWPHTYHGAFGYIDGAYFAMAPIGSLTVDSATSTGPIKLSWSMQVPQDVHDFYFDIEYGYDVQVYDSQVGQWTNLLTGTQATNTVFNGAIGHTYQFRVLPFYGYVPDNHRLNGLFTDPVTVTVGDLVAPASAVAALPAVQTSPNFMVRWSGSDNISVLSALRFDVQYRQAPTGPWTDWQKGIHATSATFNAQAGRAYDFRSRAYDEANNAEAYPSIPDASTAIALAIEGSVRDMRDRPVPLASVAFSPAGIGSAASSVDGQYTEWVLTADNYTFDIARAEFGSLPSMRVAASAPSATAPDAFLPPSNDLIKNGQFESGNLNGWILSAQNAPVLTAQAHSGGKAVVLGGDAGVESSLQQRITLSPVLNLGTLAYMARAPSGGSDPFTVSISGAQRISITTPSITSNWSHQWLDLSAFAGQGVTIAFAYTPGSANATLLLDEIEVGSIDSVPLHQTFLPMVIR